MLAARLTVGANGEVGGAKTVEGHRGPHASSDEVRPYVARLVVDVAQGGGARAEPEARRTVPSQDILGKGLIPDRQLPDKEEPPSVHRPPRAGHFDVALNVPLPHG